MQRAPRLHRISCTYLDYDAHLLGFPWGWLTHLSVLYSLDYGMTATDALDTLRQCPNLRGFALEIKPSRDSVRPVEYVTLPVSEFIALQVAASTSMHISELCDNLLVTKLRDLKVSVLWNSPLSGLPAHVPFIALLSRPTSQLQSLTLHYMYMSEAVLIECLQLASSVTRLIID